MNKNIERLLNKIVIKQENDINCWDDVISLMDEAIKSMPSETLAKMQWEIDYAKNYVEENITSRASKIPSVRIKEVLQALNEYLDMFKCSYGTKRFDLCKTIFDVIIIEFNAPMRKLEIDKGFTMTNDMFTWVELKTVDEVYAYYKKQIEKCLSYQDVTSFEFYVDMSILTANSYNIDALR